MLCENTCTRLTESKFVLLSRAFFAELGTKFL